MFVLLLCGLHTPSNVLLIIEYDIVIIILYLCCSLLKVCIPEA